MPQGQRISLHGLAGRAARGFPPPSGRGTHPAVRSPRPRLAAYRTSFCGRCGSPVPDPQGEGSWFEVHPGTLDDDPGLRPERHILVEAKSPWFTIIDSLPQLDRAALT